MPSYRNLAIIALAASFVSPALSALTRECRKHSRGEVEERVNTEKLERLETNFAPRTVPAFSKRSFGRSSTAATEAPESRAIAELEGRDGRNLMKAGAIGGGVAAAGVAGYYIYRAIKGQADYEKNNHRDVSPSQMNSVLDTMGERADVPLEDSDTIFRLLTRALNELD